MHSIPTSISETYKEMQKTLTSEQFELYNKFLYAREEAFIEDADNHYVEGFKIYLLM